MWHTSLIAIGAGFIVVLQYNRIAARSTPLLTAVFLFMTALTCLTGFVFPYKGVTPAIVLGILSLIVLVLAFIARRRAWRGTYVISAILALYFNFFVLIVQSFQKTPSLHALAPTQTELLFKLTQLIALLLFVALTTIAFKKHRST